jgi:hypothetical protein
METRVSAPPSLHVLGTVRLIEIAHAKKPFEQPGLPALVLGLA